jgi:hypothetical protein
LPTEQRDAYSTRPAGWLLTGRVGCPEEAVQIIFLLATIAFITGTVLECDGGSRPAMGTDALE